MKFQLCFLLVISGTVCSLAQGNITVVGTLNGKLLHPLRDTLIQREKDLEKNRLPYNGIPNAIITRPLPPAFIGNNGEGFDMYESRLDNMGILKPDSSFVSNMPIAIVKNNNRNTNVGPSFTIPLTRLNELREKQKKRDSLFNKPIRPQHFPYIKKQPRPLF